MPKKSSKKDLHLKKIFENDELRKIQKMKLEKLFKWEEIGFRKTQYFMLSKIGPLNWSQI